MKVDQSVNQKGCESRLLPNPESLSLLSPAPDRQRIFKNTIRAQAEAAMEAGNASHSADFASVWWFGKYYEFTPLQAAIVAVLWDAWTNGTPGVGQPHLLGRAGAPPSSRLVNIFHTSKAWGEMIICSRKNVYRIRVPAEYYATNAVITPLLFSD